MKPIMADYIDSEAQDARTVDHAAEILERLDLEEVERLLQPVIANTPANYANEFEKEGTRYIKFWDRQDLTAYSAMCVPREAARIVWLSNAYPRAHYYMAYICVERQQPHEALRWLDAGIELEPTQPRLRLEKAKVLSGLGQFIEALRMYENVLDDGTLLDSLRAVALRGRGFQLIELGILDEAEQCFQKSLTIDPDSAVARNELDYIYHLRSGGEAASADSVATSANTARHCGSCGAPVLTDEGATSNGACEVSCEACVQNAEHSGRAFGGTSGLDCGCIANQVSCNGFAVIVVKDPCQAHVAKKDVIQQLLPPDPGPIALVRAALHALYFARTGGRDGGPPLEYADQILSGLAADKQALLKLCKNDVRHAAVAAMASNIVRRGKR
jgi:tetratricopeptide (TPR) repeat protein